MSKETRDKAEAIRRIVRPRARKLARQGKLIDESFKVFRDVVYPNAPPEQIRELRIAFFAGGQELFSLIMSALDEGEEETEGDLDFVSQIADELERFHGGIIATAMVDAKGRPQ